MSDRVLKSTRLPADVAVYIEQRAESEGIPESEVHRRLIQDGIRYRKTIEGMDDRLQAIHRDVKATQSRLDRVNDRVQQSVIGRLFRGD